VLKKSNKKENYVHFKTKEKINNIYIYIYIYILFLYMGLYDFIRTMFSLV